MPITTLKASPKLIDKTISLIEKSFHYTKPNSFRVDFAPLVDEANHHNCFVLTDEKENVCAHIGVCERDLGGHRVALLGGIAVDEGLRGQGLFQELMTDVMAEKISDVAFFLLWSDKESLYKKFGFHLAGPQYELAPAAKPAKAIETTTFAQLSPADRLQIERLYRERYLATTLSLTRTSRDWDLVAKITSADLLLHRTDGVVDAYCFMNKGQDLGGVIYELVGDPELFNSRGRIWSPSPLTNDSEGQFQFMICPADQRLFADFVRSYTKGLMEVRKVSAVTQEVFFDFGGDTLVLETEDFLRGLLGPGQFEELGVLTPVFISGLDSI